jgi:hypothetical protein
MQTSRNNKVRVVLLRSTIVHAGTKKKRARVNEPVSIRNLEKPLTNGGGATDGASGDANDGASASALQWSSASHRLAPLPQRPD